MNKLQNSVQLIGRLGDDITLQEAGNGNKYARISVATNEVYYNQEGEKVENTTWHNCIAWGKSAENLGSYAAKGTQLAINGKLTNRNYEDKEGIKRYVTEVQVNEFMLLS